MGKKQINNTCDFGLPLIIDNDNNYRSAVKQKIEFYISQFESLLSNQKLKNYKNDLVRSIFYLKGAKERVLQIIDDLLQGKDKKANETMSFLLGELAGEIITPLNKSNAFLGNVLDRNENETLDCLYLFKGRESKDQLHAVDMTHMPLNMRQNVGTYRFSVPGIPCIYLASNSYVVWKELRCPDKNNLQISYYKIDDPFLLNYNVIDISLPIDTYYGILSDEISGIEKNEYACKYVIRCLKSVALIIACSVVCQYENDEDDKRKFKIEYMFPQLLSRYMAENLYGIAYRSNQIHSGGLMAVNLALPIVRYSENNKYGDIISQLSISDPLNFEETTKYILQQTNPDAILSAFNNTLKGVQGCKYPDEDEPYLESAYYKFDQYLVNNMDALVVENEKF